MLRNPIIGVLTIILLLIAINLVWLDIIIFSQIFSREEVTTSTAQTPSCDDACREMIADQVKKEIVIPSQAPSVVSQASSFTTKEYYVPLGSGSTRSNEYVALDGAEAYVDTSLYGSIKQVTFEVFLRNPTGNGVAYAKLFNVTDKHDVWFSEVSMVGGGTARKEAKVTLEPGNKLYRVYLKSTLAYDVYVDTSRIRIETQ